VKSELSHDPLLDLVSRLPPASPSHVAAERVRGRAHALLAPRHAPVPAHRGLGARLADVVLALAGIGYLLSAVGEALKLTHR
jgi:hypothetical protein